MPEMLSAAEVAERRERWFSYPTTLAYQDVTDLAEQDARWRALVTDLREYAQHEWPCRTESARDRNVCTCGLEELGAQVQAALDGTG